MSSRVDEFGIAGMSEVVACLARLDGSSSCSNGRKSSKASLQSHREGTADGSSLYFRSLLRQTWGNVAAGKIQYQMGALVSHVCS